MVKSPRRPAFTIAEIIVALVITAFLAAATTMAISQAAKARDASVARVDAHLRAEAAVSRIAGDAENTVRDAEVYFTRLMISHRGGDSSPLDEILMYSRSLRLARPRSEQGEGGEYEIQYRIEPLPIGAGPLRTSTTNQAAFMALWRRVDPVPDDIPDGGGVAAAIVTGVASLSIKASDGKNWFSTWDSDKSGFPHAISITAVAADDTGRYTSTARRIVALDRTPVPEVPVTTTEETNTNTGQPQ